MKIAGPCAGKVTICEGQTGGRRVGMDPQTKLARQISPPENPTPEIIFRYFLALYPLTPVNSPLRACYVHFHKQTPPRGVPLLPRPCYTWFSRTVWA